MVSLKATEHWQFRGHSAATVFPADLSKRQVCRHRNALTTHAHVAPVHVTPGPNTCTCVQKALVATWDMKVLPVAVAIEYLESRRKSTKRDFGLIIELKRPAWHEAIGLPLEPKLTEIMKKSPFGGT